MLPNLMAGPSDGHLFLHVGDEHESVAGKPEGTWNICGAGAVMPVLQRRDHCSTTFSTLLCFQACLPVVVLCCVAGAVLVLVLVVLVVLAVLVVLVVLVVC